MVIIGVDWIPNKIASSELNSVLTAEIRELGVVAGECTFDDEAVDGVILVVEHLSDKQLMETVAIGGLDSPEMVRY